MESTFWGRQNIMFTEYDSEENVVPSIPHKNRNIIPKYPKIGS
jgi:hypothetical protein